MKTIKSPWLVPEARPANRNYDWAWSRKTKMNGYTHTGLWVCHHVTSQLFDIQDAKKIRILLTAEQPKGNYATIEMASIQDPYQPSTWPPFFLRFYYVNGIERELYPYFEEWVMKGMDRLKTKTLFAQVEVL